MEAKFPDLLHPNTAGGAKGATAPNPPLENLRLPTGGRRARGKSFLASAIWC
jgi:hypothetical protein